MRWIEATAWALGIALLSSYAALRVSSERDSRASVQAFQTLRRDALAQVATDRLRSPLARIDQSLWSKARVHAFQQAKVRELPQGILSIPALRLVVPIYSGTTPSELDRGVGHIEGSAPLDAEGNVAIAGHRDGFFRTLGRMRIGQTLYVETLAGTRTYRVTEKRIVAPSDVSVLAPTARPSVTLVTCYPFYFVGPAPRRFVVRAELFPGRRTGAVERTAALSQPRE